MSGAEAVETGVLDRVARLAAELDASDAAQDARALAERVREGRFYVTCIGQFKRGKSTLLNALVGDAVLPAGVIPVTAAITILRFGEKKSARVELEGGRRLSIDPGEIISFVAEEKNPDNEKGVLAVEVFLPSPLLASGMCLVDTPGLGSVHAANTAATRAFVPHIDAALVVLGADPPITGEELGLVEEVARDIPHLIFVLNKADRLSDAERGEARAFAAQVLERRLGRAPGPIFEVSAGERLSTGRATRDWDALERKLRALAHEAGADLVQAAQARGLGRLLDRLVHHIDAQRAALERPLAESEHRLEELRRLVSEAERSMQDLAYLFSAEQARLSKSFSAEAEAFIARATPAATRELLAAIDATGEPGRAALRKRAMTLAQEISQRFIDEWRREIQPKAEAMYRQASARFVETANDFLERLARSGKGELAALPGALELETGFRWKSGFFATRLMRLTGGTPVTWALDRIGPRGASLRSIREQASEYLAQLIETNTWRLANDLDDRVVESRRSLEQQIRSRLRELTTTAERALERAREKSAAGADAVRAELDRLDSIRREVQTLRAAAG
jgi:hypothetical protein